MPAFNIDSFKSIFDSGARTYLFWCKPNIPNEPIESYIYVKSTSLPSSEIEESPLTYNGFDYKVHIKRSYSDWTVSFLSDRSYKLRKSFEDWQNLLAGYKGYGSIGDKNIYRTQNLIPLDYNGKFLQLSSGASNLISLVDAWPKSIGDMTFDYSAQDVVQFDVTFSYQYYEMLSVSEDMLKSII
jgi:hypothetical protein